MGEVGSVATGGRMSKARKKKRWENPETHRMSTLVFVDQRSGKR